jgi:probable rRNA maturation factor
MNKARGAKSAPEKRPRPKPPAILRAHKINVLIQDRRWEKALPRLVTFTRRFALSALEASSAKVETTIVLSSDSVVRGLNHQFRGKNQPTNVLSFPPAPPPKPPRKAARLAEIGEIVLAYETVRKEAMTQGKPFVNHLGHLVVHGILHLLGYDHERPGQARVMERLEAETLSMLGMPNPYGRGRPRRG